nr:mannose-6-phosphate isomerase [Bacteroidales bacterium]
MKSNYNKIPSVKVEGSVVKEWEAIISELNSTSAKVIALECYVGVNFHEIATGLDSIFSIDTRTLLKAEAEVREMTQADVSDDAIFGFISRLRMADFMDADKLARAKEQVAASRVPVIVYGPGALLVVPDAKVKVYADMARWEIQMRMRRQAVHGLGVDDSKEAVNIQYKRGYFVDWRVCDKFKQEHFEACDYLLDTNKAD